MLLRDDAGLTGVKEGWQEKVSVARAASSWTASSSKSTSAPETMSTRMAMRLKLREPCVVALAGTKAGGFLAMPRPMASSRTSQ